MTFPVRVRIAPSPTGEPHIGTIYTALINEAFARRHTGAFILRIEDTDQSRSTPDSERQIMNAFTWLGLEWAEGPDKGGPHAPYRQSERKPLYAEHAKVLLENGFAFRCFCTPERLEAVREAQRAAGQQPMYDGHCLRIPVAEREARAAAGEPHVVRMRVPEEGTCDFTDGVYGPISIPWATIDMQVLVKSDGMPTYHLANVVDDHLMEISHVIRGEEWMSSTPKHLLLYRHFGWQPPGFIHLPLMRNLDRTKLSKRRNPTSISWFEAQGYVPEALVNMLGLFFVPVPDGAEELMTRDELRDRFDFAHVSKAGPVFDLKKLGWLNGRWIRERLSEDDYLARIEAWENRDGRKRAGLALAKSRIEKFSDLPALTAFLFRGDLDLTPESFAGVKTKPQQTAEILAAAQALADTVPDWNPAALQEAVTAIANDVGVKLRVAVGPLFVALTGSQRSLPLFDGMALVGRSMCRERFRRARAAFGTGATEATAE